MIHKKKSIKKKNALIIVIISEIVKTGKKTMGEGRRGLNDIYAP